MTKYDRRYAALELREAFVEQLRQAFAEMFDGTQIETYWSLTIGSSGGYLSTFKDKEDAFNEEQVAFLRGFEAAWLRAAGIVQAPPVVPKKGR
jgi:hypothetical protein